MKSEYERKVAETKAKIAENTEKMVNTFVEHIAPFLDDIQAVKCLKALQGYAVVRIHTEPTYGQGVVNFDKEQKKIKDKVLAFKIWCDIHTKPNETIGFVDYPGGLVSLISLDALYDWWDLTIYKE